MEAERGNYEWGSKKKKNKKEKPGTKKRKSNGRVF